MTFLLSEDKALRELLQGISVVDQKADGTVNPPRQVGVWFGQPDQELRGQNYPYITIDMIDISRDPQREMRGLVSPDYLAPSDLGDNEGFVVDMPIPVNIDYQITTYARHPRHDRELLAQVLYGKLPFRFGVLNLDDGTVRRLDVIGVAKRDATEQAKRLFVNAITVRVSSEIVEQTLQRLTKVQTAIVSPPTTANQGGRPGDPMYVGNISSTITS